MGYFNVMGTIQSFAFNHESCLNNCPRTTVYGALSSRGNTYIYIYAVNMILEFHINGF